MYRFSLLRAGNRLYNNIVAGEYKGGKAVRKALALALAVALSGAAFGGEVVVGKKEFNLNIPFCGS